MFLHPVCDYVYRGVSVRDRSLFRGVSVQGGSLSRGSLSKGVSLKGVEVSVRGSLSKGVSVKGVGVSVRETPLYGKERVVCILLECFLVLILLMAHRLCSLLV